MTIYLIIISIIAVLVTLYDKAAAGVKRIRVPERVLFGIAAIGGALAMFFTMILIRHKTRKLVFMAGLPVLITIHVLLWLAFVA